MDLTDLKNLPADELEAVVKELREVLAEKQGKAALPRLLDMLQDLYIQGKIDLWQRAFINQDRKEKKRRLAFIIRLSAELEQIREKTVFATGLAEAAIESVIEGNWKMLSEWAKHFSFKDEAEDLREVYEPIYAKFVSICREAEESRRSEARSLH